MQRNKMFCLVALTTLLFSFSFVAFAGQPEEDKRNAFALGQTLQELMISNYSCQRYLGGLGHYRAAKLIAVNTYAYGTGDRNKAVLTMDRIEQQIIASKVNERMEAMFNKKKLSYIDRVGTCTDLTAQSMDKVEVLQAKLGMLH